MKKIIIAALAAVMILSVAACGSSETANSTTAAESVATESTAAETAETVDTAETENTAATEEPAAVRSLVGSWEHELGYTYVFREDKTGEYDIEETGEPYWVFTYETEGNHIIMYNEDGSVLMETEYKIDGDTLMIMDSFGTKVYYTFKG